MKASEETRHKARVMVVVVFMLLVVGVGLFDIEAFKLCEKSQIQEDGSFFVNHKDTELLLVALLDLRRIFRQGRRVFDL